MYGACVSIGDQRGPFRFHEEELWANCFAEEGVQSKGG
jgi:hypothetical protein